MGEGGCEERPDSEGSEGGCPHRRWAEPCTC